MGSVLVTRKAKVENPLRVMLAAHMDEVGFILTAKEENGLFNFEVVGGLDVRQLAGKAVLVGRKHVNGVIGARPIHLTTYEDRERTIPLDTLRIDLGPGGSDLAKPGDRATFATCFQALGPSLCGKALDDRLGVATLIELVKNAPENIELLAAFTVQEEVGARGAKVAAYAFNPDLAFVLDCTPANDLPTWDESENKSYNTRLDAGPAIYIADHSTISDPRLVRFLMQTADRHGIPFQVRQPGGGGTDAGAIHVQRMGIPAVSLSVPGRYIHSAAAIVRRADWEHSIELMQAALREVDRSVLGTDR
jgi:tetrahedral aminopeptidase